MLNKALRLVNGDTLPYNTAIQQLHEKWNVTPTDVRLFDQNFNTWEKLEKK